MINCKGARILGLRGLPGREELPAAPRSQLEAEEGGGWGAFLSRERAPSEINSPGKPALGSVALLKD